MRSESQCNTTSNVTAAKIAAFKVARESTRARDILNIHVLFMSALKGFIHVLFSATVISLIAVAAVFPFRPVSSSLTLQTLLRRSRTFEIVETK